MDHEDDILHETTVIARCRELLGQEADGLSDREVDQVRRHADAIAHVIIDMYLHERATRD